MPSSTPSMPGRASSVPGMVMTAGADDACPPEHTDLMFDALGSADKVKVTIDHANHYFTGADGKSHLKRGGRDHLRLARRARPRQRHRARRRARRGLTGAQHMALFDDYQAILFNRRGRVLEVTLNRPDKLNATDAVLHTELARVFTDISNDPDSDVVVLTGAGRAFSAGGDIAWMQEAIDAPSTASTRRRARPSRSSSA